MASPPKSSRSSKTGQFVTEKFAKDHPSTTETEKRATLKPAAPKIKK